MFIILIDDILKDINSIKKTTDFFVEYVKDICDRLPDQQDPHYKELINQHYFVTIPLEDRKKFEAFIDSQPSGFIYRLLDRKQCPVV